MDNFKPNRGGFKNRANAANAALKKGTLSNLYQQSELKTENKVLAESDDELIDAAPKIETPKINKNIPSPASEQSDDSNLLDDIDLDANLTDFIDKTPAQDEEEAPLKKSELKKRAKADLKAAKKAERAKHSGTIKLVVFLVILLAGLSAGAFFFFKPKLSEELADSTIENQGAQADLIYYSALTGREVANADQVHLATTCVMIENSTDARPQSGLNQAGVIYETIAEGGITRFMAIFQDTKPNYIGPVRSARIAFVELGKPYHCTFAHAGGSGNALQQLRGNFGYRNLDDDGSGKTFYRIRERHSPHNLYTNFERIDAYNFSKGYATSDYTGFTRIKADTTPDTTGAKANKIRIGMSSPLYNPIYEYDATTNTYLRSHERGGAHKSRNLDGSEIQNAPNVVIAMKTTTVPRGGPDGYADYVTTGENDAYVFQNGTVTAGKWRRASADDELKFYNEQGQEIALNRGQVWISLYPSTSTVTWE